MDNGIAVRSYRTPLPLRRRTAAEQRVIRMIRGDDSDDGENPPIHAGQFAKLRSLAARNALVIQEPGVPYLSANELNLLVWLAQAQRISSYTRQFHPDAMLTMTVVHCAGTLDAMGIRLPSLAMHNPSVQADFA